MQVMSFRGRDEQGSVIVVCMLIMVLLSFIGLAATQTSNVEIQIAGNQKFHQMAFSHADSGVYGTPKLISETIDNAAAPNEPGVQYFPLDDQAQARDDFYREVAGLDDWDSTRDVQITLAGFNVDVDVNRTGVKYLAGGGVGFASGSEGVGTSGGKAIFFRLDSLGEGPSSSQANILADYRKVVNVGGGL